MTPNLASGKGGIRQSNGCFRHPGQFGLLTRLAAGTCANTDTDGWRRDGLPGRGVGNRADMRGPGRGVCRGGKVRIGLLRHSRAGVCQAGDDHRRPRASQHFNIVAHLHGYGNCCDKRMLSLFVSDGLHLVSGICIRQHDQEGLCGPGHSGAAAPGEQRLGHVESASQNSANQHVLRAGISGEPFGTLGRKATCGEFERWFQGEFWAIFRHG